MIFRGAVLPACTIAGQTAAHHPARTALRPLFRRVCPIQRQRNAISCHNIVFIFLQWATISHKKHGFQNIKGVFSHCAGAFSVGNDCVHSRTACECRKFSSVATLKVLFFRIQTLLLQAMALYIHGPLRCKDLLGRIPNPHSRPALAAPQHAPGPRSDARSQRTPPGEIMHRSAAPHPAAAPATERPAPPAHL